MENKLRHIAFIADGNGRWAQKRALERFAGHKEGVEAIKRVLKRCYERGIEVVTFYCLSTENLARPESELDYIFNLLKENKKSIAEILNEKNAQLRVIGEPALLPRGVQEALSELCEGSKNNDSRRVVCIAIAYGARREMVEAVKKIVASGAKEIDENTISSNLYTAGLPDPDLIVRASGELRLSNFLLYQAAYAELYFPKRFWPDFDEKFVDHCIAVYEKRKRRFGKI